MIQRVPVQGMNFNNSNSASNSLPQLKNAGEGNTGMEVQSPTFSMFGGTSSLRFILSCQYWFIF
jgi:hypothetical protein